MTIVDVLRPFVKRSRAPEHSESGDERCEVCSALILSAHPHLLRREPRGVLCACTPCATLFRDSAASGGRLRTIPERVLSDARASLSDAQWAALGIPVGLAFFVVDSRAATCTAYCPSPAGAVEIEISPPAWEEVTRRLPLARAMESDVEALLVHRPRGGDTEVLLAPIDACYALAGRVRMHWRGFDGGDEARRTIAELLAALRERSEPFSSTRPENR